MPLKEEPVKTESRCAALPAPEAPRPNWRQVAGALAWALGCSVLGAALLILPWLWVWDRNFFGSWRGGWPEVWLSPYFRGAVNGLGLINVGVSFYELLRLLKWLLPEGEGDR